jgi:peptidoglycan hydrolase CwlO-like protein
MNNNHVKIDGMNKKLLILLLSMPILILAFLAVPSKAKAVECTMDTAGKNDQQLQEILTQCEKEINEQKGVLESTKKQSSLLQGNITSLTNKIKTMALEIKARNAQIQRLEENITTKSGEIRKLDSRVNDIRDSISKIVRESVMLSNYTMPEILLSNDSLSDFLKDTDDYSVVNSALHELSLSLRGLKDQTEQVKKELEDRQNKEETLKLQQEKAKRLNESFKTENQQLLKYSKSQESAYAKAIAEKEKVRNEIRNRLFRTVGGAEMKFGDAVKILAPYEDLIGVDTALVLAILTQESSVDGVIGRNIGKCTYNQTARNKDGTVMSNSQKASFLAIMNELSMNPDTTPVSCPIYQDGQYGGAIGPAQFMPKTWWDVGAGVGYKNRIAQVVGVSTPSPFTPRDAFIGTALYLKDAQRVCYQSFSKTSDVWACAASKYYGGLALKGSVLSKYMYGTYGYGHQVANRAAQFSKDIDLLNN